MTDPLKFTVPQAHEPDSTQSDADPVDTPPDHAARPRARFLDELKAIRLSKGHREASAEGGDWPGQPPALDQPPARGDDGVPQPAAEEPPRLHATWQENGDAGHGEQPAWDAHGDTGHSYAAPTPAPDHPYAEEQPAMVPEPRITGHAPQLVDPRAQEPDFGPDDGFDSAYAPDQAHTPFEVGDRDFADELRRLINEPEPAAPRHRRLAGPIVKVTGIVAISAVAAFLVVTFGDISAPGTDGTAVEHEAATEETDIAANGMVAFSSPEETTETTTSAEPAGSTTRSQFGPNEAQAAERSSGWQPVTPDRDSVRQIEVVRPSEAGFGQSPVDQATGADDSWSPPTADTAARDEPAATGEEDTAATAPGTADPFEETATALTEPASPTEEPAAATSLEMATPADDPASANGASQSAQTTADVNLRDAPENDATILAVIPADGEVELIGCDIWCEVVYDGRQGWVYRDYIAGTQ